MAKPADPDSPWRSLLGSLLVLIALSAAGGLAFKLWLDNRPRPLTVSVQLDNQCALVEDAFVVVSTDGSTAEFVKGVARLSTMSDQRVSLRSHPKYPAFVFESPPVKVKAQMTLAAECSSTESKIESLREQFQPKK